VLIKRLDEEDKELNILRLYMASFLITWLNYDPSNISSLSSLLSLQEFDPQVVHGFLMD
jgi:hypothetical protein